MKPIDVDCPKCGRPAGEVCRRDNGTDRVYFHEARALKASGASRLAKLRESRKKRVVKRFGAFLRLYGPKGKPTHAVMVLGHGPEPDTPRAFMDELDAESKLEGQARQHGIGTEWRLHFNGRPRLRLPSYGATTRRVLNGVWQPGAALPPLACAGKKQMGPAQALHVAGLLGNHPYVCPHCGRYHLKGKGKS